MSIKFSGRLWRGTILNAVIAQLKTFTFKPVKQITVQFDPFHEKVDHTRNFLHYISAPRILRTNLSCYLKANVVCDRSEPTVTCDLINGEKVLFKCNNLDVVDILKLYNKHISSLAPPEVPETTGGIVKLKKKKRKRRPIPSRR
ncbi:39S ribosomal protein L53, mitochondrial [Chelonus insularis]|uniref:39S ribosomal protein L53, mitochondrial n=1 Tax=Chelonus insularis TaxID=460826 RepID=UPI00158A2DC3|nr:39S ribosomal protein L53, mitochondrial [Chelonus insularis]